MKHYPLFNRPLAGLALVGLLAAGGSGPLAPALAAPAAAPNARITVEDAAGKVLFVLDPSGAGYKVEGAGGKKLGTVKVEADRVKLADDKLKPAYKVKQKEGGFKLYREPAQAGGADAELANLVLQGAEFVVKNPQDREVYKGRTTGASSKVNGAGGRQLVVKSKPDGLEVEDASGKRLVRIKGIKSIPAAVFIAGSEYDTLQKAAVTAFSARIGP